VVPDRSRELGSRESVVVLTEKERRERRGTAGLAAGDIGSVIVYEFGRLKGCGT
jgi:hypothetical protein